MAAMCEFLEKANKKLREATGNPNAEVNVLSTGNLIAFKNEGVETYMVAGRSADFKPEEARLRREIRSEIASGLSRFGADRTVFFPGGTASGTVGEFHDLAVRRGFRVVGVTSLAALSQEPALMTDIYFELGEGFGAESNTAVSFAKGILMLGGGRQTAREAIKMAFAGKPVSIVINSRLGGKSQEVATALADQPNVSTFPSFAAVADTLTASHDKILSRLPEGGYDISAQDLKELYKGMKFVGFSTWVQQTRAPTPALIKQFEDMVIGMLDRMDPAKVVIVVAGTSLGGEGFVIEEATKRGFEVVGTPVESVTREMLSGKITKFVESGKTWETRNHLFTHLIDVLITAGSSTTIVNHIEAMQNAKKPVFHLRGVSAAVDAFVSNLDETILAGSNDVSRILEKSGIGAFPVGNICKRLLGK